MATIVCVVGDKGGTGKSTWARGLADLYRQGRRPVALFDGDWLARSLFKFFRGSDDQGRPLSLDRQDPRRGCILYDARDRRFGRDLLLNSMALPGIDVILHDLPAGFRTDITALMGTATPAEAVKEFVACAASMGHRVVLVNVMTPSPSDHHTAPWLVETVGGAATVIAVRNGMFDAGSYGLWQREAAKAFAAAGGVEIEMPRLDTDAAILCDQRMARFTAAVADDRLALADRMRILSWLRRFTECLGPVTETLRLPADTVSRIAALRIEATAPEAALPETTAPEASAPKLEPEPEPTKIEPAKAESVAAAVPPAPTPPLPPATMAPPDAEPRPVPRPRPPRRPLSDILTRGKAPDPKPAGAKEPINDRNATGITPEERFLLSGDAPLM